MRARRRIVGYNVRIMDKRVLAVIPAYNEQDNIVSTIEDLRSNAPEVDYVIVNDGSKDRTPQICEERGYHYLSLPVNLGLAGAFQTGMKYANSRVARASASVWLLRLVASWSMYSISSMSRPPAS